MGIMHVLEQHREELPEWLTQPVTKFDRRSFFHSRTVYYPGSGIDGQAVSLCGRAHAAHAFVYVDNSTTQQAISDRVNRRHGIPFDGYTVEYEQELEEADIWPGGVPVQHGDWMGWRGQVKTPYVLFVVLTREDNRDDTHGPIRHAILFVGDDGFARYDALYCQSDGTPPPFLVVIENQGIGGPGFGADGLLEGIAQQCNVLPKWLLVGRAEPWFGYHDTGAEPECGGMMENPRRLFRRIL